MTTKLAQTTVTLPADWWTAFLKQAAMEEMSLSEWIGDCCRSYLTDIERQRLSPLPEPPATRGPIILRHALSAGR